MNQLTIFSHCPKCGQTQEDHDGLGVLHCETCGYCIHPSRTGNTCDICGHVAAPTPETGKSSAPPAQQNAHSPNGPQPQPQAPGQAVTLPILAMFDYLEAQGLEIDHIQWPKNQTPIVITRRRTA